MNSGVATLLDVQTIEATPPELPASTYEMIRRTAVSQPLAPALSFFLRTQDHRQPEVWTYQALLARIHQSGNFFHGLGVGRDDVVAFALPNLPETHFTIWGAQTAGIVFAINPLLEGQAMVELLNATQACVLVTLAPFPGSDLWSRLQPGLARVPSLRHVVLVDLADRVRGVKRLAARWLQWRETRRQIGPRGLAHSAPPGVALHDFNAALDQAPAQQLLNPRTIAAQDRSSYFCTGGTTGTPKVAVRSHGNEVANAWSAGQFLGDHVGTGKNIFCGLPLFHVNAVLVTGLAAFAKGAHVILGTPQGYRGEGLIPRFWEVIEHHRIHFFSGVPTLFAALMQHPAGDHDLSCLEYALCGAAPLPVELMHQFQNATGVKILEGYGLTEGTCASSLNPPMGVRKPGSIGLRLPLQPMKAVRLDEQGRYLGDCAADEIGLLAISGPNVFAGYLSDRHNQDLWIDAGDRQRWLNTGDLGRQDAEGYFFLTGRKKELIIRGGHNIDPACIEEPLHRHPAVQLAAAVGRPDAHAGELPVAYVQLKPGALVSELELCQFVQTQITERAAIPKSIHVLDEMPVTGVGKIYKPALRLREVQSALQAALAQAGACGASLTAEPHPRHGTLIRVALAEPIALGIVQDTLARFPFQFDITVMAPAAADAPS